MVRRTARRRGMSTLQAVLLLGAGFLTVWGLMDVWKELQDPLQTQAKKTLRGEMGNITPGSGQVPTVTIDAGPAANREPELKRISHIPTKPKLPPTGGAGDTTTGANPGESEGKTTLGGFLDGLQTTLDIGGLVPGLGEPLDLLNAGISALRGDWLGAGLGLTSAVPFLGWGGTAAKFARNLPLEQLVKHADEAKLLLKEAEAAGDLKKAEEARELIAALEKEQARKAGQKAIGSPPPTLGSRRISKELYDELRAATPTPAIRDMVNEGKLLPFPDPVLPGLTVTKRLHADHIVSMDTITRMQGFDRLTKDQMLSVLNNRANFIGLSEAANASKGSKSFAEWVRHKSKGVDVDEAFRQRMMLEETRIGQLIQQQINGFLK